MATEESEQSPFARPTFIVAAIVVGLIVVAGVVLSLIFALGGNSSAKPAPTPPPNASPTPSPTTEGDASVCGLGGDVVGSARLTKAPTVDEWAYRGTTAYPTSTTAGPGKKDPAGFAYCFQRSPDGAVIAAANAVVQASDTQIVSKWLSYFVAPGPYHDALVNAPATSGSSEDTRIRIAGFRLLNYDGKTARVDIAATMFVKGQNITLSGVYDLIWSDGDWKQSAESAEPLKVTAIPNLAGYVAWGE